MSIGAVVAVVLFAVRPGTELPAVAPRRPDAATPPATNSEEEPLCSGEYAEDMSALHARARRFEAQQAAYTFCIRTTAVYECPFYGPDGDLRRARRRVVAHGTGFAYDRRDAATLLLTNEHVAEWPAATDDQHRVENVPTGCRRVSDELKIVDREDDEYEADDIPLTRVVTDPQLDVAVLKTSATLPVMPWKVGRSAAVRERDVVNVRGFPLGHIKADTVGKVVSALDHDDYKDWDHDDFVVDALLSPGNSGSPVLAVSCKTGEFELVGVYHAAYSGGSALNVVVGIDQVRDLMTTLRSEPRAHAEGVAPRTEDGRSILAANSTDALEPVFPFGPLVAAVRARPEGALWFEVYSPGYPVENWPLAVIEDMPGAHGDAFGSIGRVWMGNHRGLKHLAPRDVDAETQKQLSRVLDALRHDAVTAFRYRAAEAGAHQSKERFRQAATVGKSLKRSIEEHGYESEKLAELAERLGPGLGDEAVTITDVLAAPAAHDGARAPERGGEPVVAEVPSDPHPPRRDARAIGRDE